MDTKFLSMLISAALGIAIMIKAGVSYGLGTLRSPGPGFFPFVMGLVVAVISGAWCGVETVHRLRQRHLPLPEAVPEQKYHRDELISAIGAMVIYAIALERAGFVISTSILLALLFWLVGKIRLSTSVFGAIVASLLCYLFFGKLLSVQLPRGILPF